MMMLRALVTVACLVALILSGGRSGAQTLPVLRTAAIADDDATAILFAVRNGLFRRAGLDVQFQPLSSGSAITAAVIGGSIDVGKSNTLTLSNAYVRGVPVTIIAPASIWDSKLAAIADLVVAPDSPVHVAKDLNGATIAVGSLKGIEQICISSWVDSHGGDSKTLHFLDMPLSAVREAFETRRVDAGMMSYPALADALASNKVRSIGHVIDGIGPHYLGTGWFSTVDWARSHPNELAIFVRVMREASVYVNAHHADTVAMISEFTSIPAARVSGMPRQVFALNLNPADLQPVIDAAAKYQAIPKSFPAAELIYTPTSSR